LENFSCIKGAIESKAVIEETIELLSAPNVVVNGCKLDLHEIINNLLASLRCLAGRKCKILTKKLARFMDEHLKGDNKSGSNRISQLQKLLNAYIQETEIYLKYLAKVARYKILAGDKTCKYVGTLKFGDDNHRLIGEDISDMSDFIYIDTNGIIHYVECKMHRTTEDYYDGLAKANMHNAELVIVYIITPKSNEVNWYFARGIEGYRQLYTLSGLYLNFGKAYDWLAEIADILPNGLQLIHIDVDSKLTNDEIPEDVEYNFYPSGGTY